MLVLHELVGLMEYARRWHCIPFVNMYLVNSSLICYLIGRLGVLWYAILSNDFVNSVLMSLLSNACMYTSCGLTCVLCVCLCVLLYLCLDICEIDALCLIEKTKKYRKQAINRKTRVFAVCIRKIHMTNRLCRVHFPNTHGNGLAEYPSRTRQSVCHVYTETKCIIILFSLNSSQVAANILPTSNIRTCKLGSLAPKGSTHDTNP
jgi:hypothetical protein